MERQIRYRRLSLEVWASVVHQLEGYSEKNISAARMVLVDGHSQKHVYQSLGLSKQRLSQIVKSVLTKIEDSREGWVYVSTWAPVSLAKEFQTKVEIARMEVSA